MASTPTTSLVRAGEGLRPLPELPEVETVRRGLADRLSSFQIHDVEILRDRAIASPGGSLLFVQALKGTWVGQWHRRGKYLYADLHDGPDHHQVAERGHWGVHLRMTGQFLWLDEQQSPAATPACARDPKGENCASSICAASAKCGGHLSSPSRITGEDWSEPLRAFNGPATRLKQQTLHQAPTGPKPRGRCRQHLCR